MTDSSRSGWRGGRAVAAVGVAVLAATAVGATTAWAAVTVRAGDVPDVVVATGTPGPGGMGSGLGQGMGMGMGQGMGMGMGQGMGMGMGLGPWGTGAGAAAPCPVASAPAGQWIRYAAMDMGGSMMGGSMMGGARSGHAMMRLMPMWARTHAGTVTIDLVNRGTRPHELLVYALGTGQRAGQRPIGSNDRISEDGVLGEVEPACAQPSDVDGIAAGNVGRVTLTLAPGRYEIVCNLPGHYRAGMYATLVVV